MIDKRKEVDVIVEKQSTWKEWREKEVDGCNG